MGTNAARSLQFDNTVKMWVFEEMVDGRKLTEIINTEHENVKYLPGHKLPSNVVRKWSFCLTTQSISSVCCFMSAFPYICAFIPNIFFHVCDESQPFFFKTYIESNHCGVTLGCFYSAISVGTFMKPCYISNDSILIFSLQLAVPDLVEASSEADILIFVIPHQFVGKVCDTIKGKIKSDALGISLIKV